MRIPRVCVCVRMFIAVQEMAEAQMLKLGVCPHVEEEGEEPNLTERPELNSSCTAGNFNEDACFIRQTTFAHVWDENAEGGRLYCGLKLELVNCF